MDIKHSLCKKTDSVFFDLSVESHSLIMHRIKCMPWKKIQKFSKSSLFSENLNFGSSSSLRSELKQEKSINRNQYLNKYKNTCFASSISTLSSSTAAFHENYLTKPTGDAQTTLVDSVTVSGIGLHSGEHGVVRLGPALAGEGRYFVILDKPNKCEHRISATVDNVLDTRLSTTLGQNGLKIQTVEHLLSALEGHGVDNVRIEIEGSEVPILDGSALLWSEAVEEAGICSAKDKKGDSALKYRLSPPDVVRMDDGDAFIVAYPSSQPSIECCIDFPHVSVIGKQSFFWELEDSKSYKFEISCARTFGILEQFEQIKKAGLIKGGSLDNALVCSMESGWLNPPLRYVDEPCRHKLLDIIGDFALSSFQGNAGIPYANIVSFKAGHSLHTKFVVKLLEACRIKN